MQIEGDAWLEIIRFHLDHVKRQQLATTCKILHHGVNGYYAKLTQDVRHRKKTIGELYGEKFFDIRKVFELDLRRRCVSGEEFDRKNYFAENHYPRYTEAGFRLVNEVTGEDMFLNFTEEATLDQDQKIILSTHRFVVTYADDLIRVKDCWITDLMLEWMISEKLNILQTYKNT